MFLLLDHYAGTQQFPQLIAPPTVLPDSVFSPAPAPSESGGIPTTNPKSSVVPSSGAVLGFPPAGGPTGSPSGSSGAGSLTDHSISFPIMLVLGLFVKFVLSFSL